MTGISFCVALMNRGDNFKRLVKSLEVIENSEIVVCDHGSTDIDFSELPVSVVRRALPFRRSDALNAAAEACTKDYLFFVDADMTVPADFSSRFFSFVKPGYCWFPICFSLFENKPAVVADENGWWRRTGFGMLGITKTDFYAVGGWSVCFHSHGGEDDDMYARCRKRIHATRNLTTGLFHHWHPNDKEFKNRYYNTTEAPEI